jgi:hypothetical protein
MLGLVLSRAIHEMESRKCSNVDANRIPKDASLSTLSIWAKELRHQGRYPSAEKYYSHVRLVRCCLTSGTCQNRGVNE